MKKNKKGFSLPLAMGLVILISLLAFTILEYIIPFSKDIKGVENSSVAYYQANTGIEEALYKVYTRNNSSVIDDRTEYSDNNFSLNMDSKYFTTSSGKTLPPTGEGNSEYDKDWNRISSGNPIQLSIGNGNITSNLSVDFRVPNLDNKTTTTETLKGGSVLPIVNWQLSSTTNTLNASGSYIFANNVLNSIQPYGGVSIFPKIGSTLDGTSMTISNFYNLNCSGTNSGCTLKLSIVNKLETTTSIPVPYLEWKMTVNSTKTIPLRYSKITSSGKSYGYKKDLEVKVPSQTVNEAFDFTVFQ